MGQTDVAPFRARGWVWVSAMQEPRIVVLGEAKLVLIEPADQTDLALVLVTFPSAEHLKLINMVQEPHIVAEPHVRIIRFYVWHPTHPLHILGPCIPLTISRSFSIRDLCTPHSSTCCHITANNGYAEMCEILAQVHQHTGCKCKGHLFILEAAYCACDPL